MLIIWQNQSVPAKSDATKLKHDLTPSLLYQVSLEIAFIVELVFELVPATAFEGEFIVTVGEECNFWDIIKTGNVVSIPALNNRVELMLFDGGSSIGECPIFLTQNTWPWTLRCASDTTYHTTAAEIFTSIVSHHKNVSRILIKLAAQRCQRYTKMKSNQVERSNTSQQQIDSRNSFCGLNYKKNNFHFRIDNPQDKNSLRIASFVFLNNEEDGEMKKQYLFQIRSFIHNDIDRNTATGRWRYYCDYLSRDIAN